MGKLEHSNPLTDIILRLLSISRRTNADVTPHQIKTFAENSCLSAEILQEVLESEKSACDVQENTDINDKNRLCSSMTLNDKIAGSEIIHTVGMKRKKSVNYGENSFNLTHSKCKITKTNVRPYKCSKCYCAFASKNIFEGHLYSHMKLTQLHSCEETVSACDNLKDDNLSSINDEKNYNKKKRTLGQQKTINNVPCSLTTFESEDHMSNLVAFVSEFVKKCEDIRISPELFTDYPMDKTTTTNGNSEFHGALPQTKILSRKKIISIMMQKESPVRTQEVFNTKTGAVEEAVIVFNCQSFQKIAGNGILASRNPSVLNLQDDRDERPVTCDVCEKISNAQSAYGRDQEVQNGEKNQDYIYSSSVESKENRKNSIYLHLDSNPYKCNICHLTFKSSHFRKLHEKLHEIRKQKQECKKKCPKCTYSTKHISKFEDHLSTHTGKTFSCTICQKIFLTAYQLQRHFLSVHHSDKPYTCSFCNKTYARLSYCENHEMAVHRKINPYACTVCTKSFTTQSGRDAHHRTQHCDEMPYGCPNCGLRFKCLSTVKKHVAHSHTRVFSHPCTLCEKGFMRPSLLKVHLRSKHKIFLDAI